MPPEPTPETPTVSVCIVTWRAREHVLACLASLEEHAGVHHEVIVVDDAGGDGTPEAVRERFPHARVVAKTVNEGLSAGRNEAVPLARGEYVLMLDADTEVRPGAIPTLLEALRRDPGIGLVGPRLEGPEGALQPSSRRWPPLLIPFMRRGPYARLNPNPVKHQRHLMQDDDHRTERPVVWVSGAAQMWPRELGVRMGPYDVAVSSYGGEDLDWCLRIWEAGRSVHYVPEAVVMHHWQAVTRQKLFGPKSWRALHDWYYLQYKHRALRRDPRLAEANS